MNAPALTPDAGLATATTSAKEAELPRTEADSGQADGPRAHCVADAAGGITFELEAPEDVAGAQAVLLLTRRGGSGPDDEVRLPLTGTDTGRMRAALPATMALPEGRWNAYLQLGGAGTTRLLPGVNDLRALLDRDPGPGAGTLAVRIPYATKFDNLAVRAWQRAPHAEAGELSIGAEQLTVRGRLFGAAVGAGADVELVHRAGETGPLSAEVTADGTEFSATLTYKELRPGTWDLWLRPAGTEGPRVRIARLLDDVADKKQVFRYPARRIDGAYGPVDAGPYYTTDNDLAVKVAAASDAE
ncbi:hypothetical protein ACIBI4_10535 [Streptomyces sp. NPDC050418]|uniref:hypothetical protein n=1 Tax=Streptomyces sp. NPDC050418 TaxID=3365612 RepID=UPI00378908E0